jgi:hypothetical protein
VLDGDGDGDGDADGDADADGDEEEEEEEEGGGGRKRRLCRVGAPAGWLRESCSGLQQSKGLGAPRVWGLRGH